MEEKPPSERRGRPVGPAFSAPAQPAPEEKPSAPAPRRPAKSAPAVTFQPPSAENHPGETPASAEVSGRSSTKPPSRTQRRPATESRQNTEPPRKASTPRRPPEAERTPAPADDPAPKPDNTAATPSKSAPAKKATPAKKAAAVKAAVKKATPAKRAPRKATPTKAAAPQPTEPEPAATTSESEPAATTAPLAEQPEPAQVVVEQPKPVPPAQPEPVTAESIEPPQPDPTATTQAEPTLPEPTLPEPTQPAPTQPEPAAAQSDPDQAAPDQAPSKDLRVLERRPDQAASDQANPPTDQPPRTEAWAKLIAAPGHTPELLALAAVQTIGPRARDWSLRTREAYPAAADHALARLAKQQFTRFGSLTSVFGAIAGSYAPITLLGTAAVTHAEIVLHLAAAYGLDPTDPQRAVDLLVITRVHSTRSDAEEALAAAERPAYETGGLSSAAWRLGRVLATQTGGWTALRLVNRYFPGTSLLAAVLTSTASAQMTAARAEAYYKKALRPK